MTKLLESYVHDGLSLVYIFLGIIGGGGHIDFVFIDHDGFTIHFFLLFLGVHGVVFNLDHELLNNLLILGDLDLSNTQGLLKLIGGDGGIGQLLETRQ